MLDTDLECILIHVVDTAHVQDRHSRHEVGTAPSMEALFEIARFSSAAASSAQISVGSNPVLPMVLFKRLGIHHKHLASVRSK